jgi:hypothetical protein
LGTALAVVGLQWVTLGSAAAAWTADDQVRTEITQSGGENDSGANYAWGRSVDNGLSGYITTGHEREYTWAGGGSPQQTATAFTLWTKVTVTGSGSAYSYSQALQSEESTTVPGDPDEETYIGTIQLGPSGLVIVTGSLDVYASAGASSELRADAQVTFANPPAP